MKILTIDTETVKLEPKPSLTDEEAQALKLGYETGREVPICFQASMKIHDTETGKEELYNAYGKPVIPLSHEAAEVTGISRTQLDKLTVKDDASYIKMKETNFITKLKELAEDKDTYLVGHKVDYDINVLKREGIDLSHLKIIDTLQLSRYLNRDSDAHRLSYLIHSTGIIDDINEKMDSKEVTDIILGETNSQEATNMISKLSGSHSSLFDVMCTSMLMDHFSLQLLKDGISTTNIYETMHEISITPFLMTEVPFGIHKEKLIVDLLDKDLLYMYNMDIDNINWLYSMEQEIDKRGGLVKMVKGLNDFSLNNSLTKEPSNPLYIAVAQKEHDDRNGLGVDKSIRLTFGKYNGKTIEEIYLIDPKYLVYAQNTFSNMSEVLKAEIARVLEKRPLETEIVKSSVKDIAATVKKEEVKTPSKPEIKTTVKKEELPEKKEEINIDDDALNAFLEKM